MHIYMAYAHYLPIICDIWCVCRAKCILYFVPCHELHFHINVSVAYEYFYIGFSKKAESEHIHTHTHSQKRTGMFYANTKCIVPLTEWSERRCTRASDLLQAKHTALCERKKELHRYLCLCATVSSKLRHHDAQCIYLPPSSLAMHSIAYSIRSARWLYADRELVLYGREVGLFGTRAMKVKFASRYM